MQLVSPNFKTIVEDLRSKVAAATDPKQTLGTARADAKLLGQQYQEVKVREFTISCDEPVPSGGTDKGPTPLDFFVASVGFCENVIFTRNAALQGVEFDTLETSVHGHWDRGGQYEIAGIDPSFKDMTVETKVTSKAPTEKIVEVVRAAHRTCPMRATIGRLWKSRTDCSLTEKRSRSDPSRGSHLLPLQSAKQSSMRLSFPRAILSA